MLSSIRIQLITVLLALIALILAQGFIARENQEVLNKGVASASKAAVDVALVKELERDVVDLQRNVLIFKENASKSAITRFSRLMVTINTKLDKLALVDEDKEIQEDKFHWDPSLEDVHMNIESRLVKVAGAAAKKIHTGRSRNDQISTDLRMYLDSKISNLCK